MESKINNIDTDIEHSEDSEDFSFLIHAVDGLENMAPDKINTKNLFLSDPLKKTERAHLKQRLELLIKLLSSCESVEEMQEASHHQIELSENLLKQNLKNVLSATRLLEQSYRSIDLFYKNAGFDSVNNLSITDASIEQLSDLDNPKIINFLAEELRLHYDRLDLSGNYSLLVIPGFLGKKIAFDRWSKIAHENKVMLVTDFANLDTIDDVIEVFSDSYFAGPEIFRSNAIMACNWIVGRGKIEYLDENEDLLIPPSAALAGKMYNTIISQVAAGKIHGSLSNAEAVNFEVKKSEITYLEKSGLVPMINEDGKISAFSGKTLFNGDNLGLQTYSVVRVFDYITKVLFDFLNRRAFEIWNTKLESDIRSQIVMFMDGIQGPGRLIQKFKIIRIEQDLKQKEKIFLEINITPYFPAKSYVVKLDGIKSEAGTNWKSEYNAA